MKKKKINSNNLLLLITIVLFFVMYAAGCIVYADKGFTRFQTFLNILINNAGLICITAGMTCVMLTGGIDISVGSLVAMDCMILAVGIEQWGWSSPVLMLLILAIGIIFGYCSRASVFPTWKSSPFIVTMAGMFFARGMTTIVNTNPFNVQNEAFVALKDTRVIVRDWVCQQLGRYVDAYVEIGVVVALLVVILMFIMLRWTKLDVVSMLLVATSRVHSCLVSMSVRTKFFVTSDL